MRRRVPDLSILAPSRSDAEPYFSDVQAKPCEYLAWLDQIKRHRRFAQRSKERSGLFQKLGGYPIKEELPSFRCCRFGTELSLIALRPHPPLLRRDDLVEGIKHHLVTQRVTVRH